MSIVNFNTPVSFSVVTFSNIPVLPDRNVDVVDSGGYYDIDTGAGNFSGNNNLPFPRTYFNFSHDTRVRISGSVTHARIYIDNLTNVSEIDFQIWRKDGATYDKIHDVNITSKLIAGNNYIEFDSPLSVNLGDHIGLCIYSDGVARPTNVFTATNLGIANSIYYEDGVEPGNNYDWTSQTPTTYVIPVKVYIQAPLMVFIGDSIMAGHTSNYSYIEPENITNEAHSIPYQLEQLRSEFVYQNMGSGGETSTEILARFTEDVVNLKPKYAIINGGVNDISGGIITKATFLSNWTAMLNACVQNDIIPITCLIMPWTNGTNGQMQTRDEWNSDLYDIAISYGSVINFDDDIGQFRAGGDADNLWDIKAIYDNDGVHLNQAGYTKCAEIIYRYLPKI